MSTSSRLASTAGRRQQGTFNSVVETLESRRLMSATAWSKGAVASPKDAPVEVIDHRKLKGRHARHNTAVGALQKITNDAAPTRAAIRVAPQVTYAPIPGAYTPQQVRMAYGVTSLGLANQGQGTTIAIVDEYDDPNILGDANVFSTQYGLPTFTSTPVAGSPTLNVIKDSAIAPVTSAVGTTVAAETSLDVEWAHAMAPYANIDLIEVPATLTTYAVVFNELLHGIQLGASEPGVVAVSLSYGTSEANVGASSVISQNNTYLANGAASNVVVAVSTGDGSAPQFPATSPNVVAVGGTSLYLASVRGQYSFETAWGGLSGEGAGGGGASTNFSAPTFQAADGTGNAKRTIPDVSMIADPVTGVSYYDSLDVTTSDPSPWSVVGGTSLATPVFAGIVALAQQQRTAVGLAPLTSTQLNTTMYADQATPASYSLFFRDVNQGNNSNRNSGGTTTVAGYSATTGYDLATGIGSPIASSLVPFLATGV